MEGSDEGQVEGKGLDPYEKKISALCKRYVAEEKPDELACEIAQLVIKAQRENQYVGNCHYFPYACFSIGDEAREIRRFVEIFMAAINAEATGEDGSGVVSSCTAFAEEVRGAAEEEEREGEKAGS